MQKMWVVFKKVNKQTVVLSDIGIDIIPKSSNQGYQQGRVIFIYKIVFALHQAYLNWQLCFCPALLQYFF